MATYNVMENNCNNFTNECNNFLLGHNIPSEIIDLPKIFMSTPLGQMMAPMLSQFQDGLKVNSNPLFNQGGEQNPINPQGA